MIKCRSRQAADPQKLKNCQRSFSRFLLVETEAGAFEKNRFHILGSNTMFLEMVFS